MTQQDIIISLTPLGEQKVQQMNGEGVLQEMLNILHENGPSSLSELSGDLNVSLMETKQIARRLQENNLIRRES
jgi:Mn-dependent DtxR family transcriptional regulator